MMMTEDNHWFFQVTTINPKMLTNIFNFFTHLYGSISEWLKQFIRIKEAILDKHSLMNLFYFNLNIQYSSIQF